MIRRPPRSKLTDTLVPYTTPSRSCRFEPSFTVHRVAVGAIELPTSALARRTVALHIAQMRLGALEAVSAQFDGANLDDGRSEEHTSELQSLMRISYAVFCLKKKTQEHVQTTHITTTSQFKNM